MLLPFLAAIVFMGVYPKPVLDRIEPSIDRLIGHVEDHTDYVEPEPTMRDRRRRRAPADDRPKATTRRASDARPDSTPSSARRSAGSPSRRC